MLTCSDGRGCSWLTVAMMTIRFAAKLSVLVSAMSEVSAMYAGDVRGLWSHSGIAPDAPVSLMLILVDPGSWCHSVPW